MFIEFLKLELRTAFKSPMLYIFFGIVALFSFAAVGSDNVQIGGAIGNVYRNAPDVLTQFTLILGIFGLLFAAAFYNNAALRDHNNQFNEIMYHLPIGKGGYFWGRFIGAWILSTLPLLGVFLGAWIGSIVGPLAGWVDGDRIGPFYASTLLSNYFIFVLPNMFFAGSIIFFLAHKFKNTIISFVGALAIIVAYLASGTLLSDIDNETVAAITDVFGIRTYNVYSRYWTPIERNTLNPMLEGIILYNRLLWLGAGVLLSVLSYLSFSFQEKLRFRKKGRREVLEVAQTAVLSRPRPVAAPKFGAGLNWQQFRSFFSANLRSITKNVVFKIVALFGILLLAISLIEGYEYYGLQSYPVTYKILDDIAGSTGLFVLIVVIFFSGELVWRDRMYNIHEVVNATPHNSFISIFAKVASLVSVAVLLQLVFVFMGVTSQLLRGYTKIELDIYLIDFFVDTLPGYIILSALFVLVQTLVNNRYVGYFIGILFITTWSIILGVVYWQSNMLQPGGSPGIFYSDMNGFGPGLEGTLWFDAYWLAFAILLIFIAGFFWPRSVVSSFREKWLVARSNFAGSARKGFVITGVVWALIAGWVYYNTIILNPYKSGKELELESVEYEKSYKKYQGKPMPVLTDIHYAIDIFPEERDVFVKASAKWINKGDEPIDTLYFNTDQRWETEIMIPGASVVLDDEALGFRIYALAGAILPGATIEMEIKTTYITKGFENSIGNTNIIKNGTFLNNFSILPSMGYNEAVELSDKNDRKKYDLPEKERMPKLEYPCGHTCMANYLTNGLADWVNVSSVISTSPDQIAVAPGSLIKEWTEGDRRYFQYELDQPSQNFYSFMSARYEVAREKHNDIDIEIYYHPSHGENIDMMVDAVRRSFVYYEKSFGPYYHKQARILEFPRYNNFAQAFPGTMPYAESFGFIINLEDENENNVLDAVIAHEMAHQWWAHQEIPALMQGGTMLTESFAEYSSLMVMKQDVKGDDMKMKNFLKYNYDRYLRGRSAEREKEMPLYKVENQQYIHYGKGSVVLYALQDYISEDSVNASMRSFLQEYAYAEPPYPSTLDYLRHLEPRVPDSLQYLVEDLIKQITLYDFRMKEATATKLPDGMYEVTFEFEARKLYADSLGNETEQPLHEWIDLGLYNDSDEKRLSAWKRVHVTESPARFTMITDSLPAKAAIDPRRMLIERVIEDNVKPIEES
jgi:hypothetical protein